MSEADVERLGVFCDVCVPAYKHVTMEPTLIFSISPAGGQDMIDGYVCSDPSCGRQYTTESGYRDEFFDSPREHLLVLCGCDASRTPMYIDLVRDDGGVRFRCWQCGATKVAEHPRAAAK